MIPVANEYKIRMACHPQDPGVPPEGYQGVDRVLGAVNGLKKFITIRESPYHGLNFCQGTVSEMLADPGKEIFDFRRGDEGSLQLDAGRHQAAKESVKIRHDDDCRLSKISSGFVPGFEPLWVGVRHRSGIVGAT